MKFRKVLVLSPHTDDGELGAGGSLARFIEEGSEVHYIALSSPTPELKNEVKQALRCLDSDENGAHLHMWEFERRTFPTHRQEILDQLYRFNEEHDPDLVLTPSTYDTHQDHETVTNEVKRAFKQATVFGYILRWNCQTIKEDVFIPITEGHVEKKIQALSQYKSQIKLRRKYFNTVFHNFQCVVTGFWLPTGYGEAFELIKLNLGVDGIEPWDKGLQT